ncbi:MAG: hypothetical protein KIT16_12800 [Rhodospirillaceae bacterium]|nr:hypothetical protein [Rhodospirillaceae bacterium]
MAAPKRKRKRRRRRRTGVWLLIGVALAVGIGVTFWAGDLVAGAFAGLGSGGAILGADAYLGTKWDDTDFDDVTNVGLSGDGDFGDFN